MADKGYNASPYIKSDPYRSDVQHFGQAAGGQGSMGRCGDGENHRQAPDAKGTMGPDVTNGLVSTAAQGLIAKSTGMNVGPLQNPDLFGHSGKY